MGGGTRLISNAGGGLISLTPQTTEASLHFHLFTHNALILYIFVMHRKVSSRNCRTECLNRLVEIPFGEYLSDNKDVYAEIAWDGYRVLGR